MILVEVIAGLGYFLQKVLLLIAGEEDTGSSRRWRIAGWIAYLVGLPMWLIIFYIESNWILMFVEGGGLPSMVLSLVIALRGRGEEPEWLNYFAVLMTFVGIAVSFYHFGVFATINQSLELSVSVGFLAGTYLLAKRSKSGWLWYMLMNASAGSLMWIQDYPLLTVQQAFSFCVCLLAYYRASKI